MQSLMIDGTAIHHRWLLRGANLPTIAFSNSLGTDFRIWDEVVERLGGGFNILLHDKRGHGLSDHGPSTLRMSNLIGDLAALLDHYGQKQVILCGLSVGGIISMGLAAQRPDLVRGLVLCNTAPKVGTAESWAERIAAVNATGIAGIADMVLSRWFTPGFRQADNPLFGMARNMLLRQPPEGYAATCAAIAETDFRPLAAKLAVPALCIAGDYDQATPPALVEDMSRIIPGSRYHLLSGCGHIPCMERPDALANLIAGFAATL